MSLAEEIALRHRLSHYVDGLGGEDGPDRRALAASNEALERAAQECERYPCDHDDCMRDLAYKIRALKSE